MDEFFKGRETMTLYADFFDQILSRKPRSKDELQRIKVDICKKYGIEKLPTDADILNSAPLEIRGKLEPLLKLKPVRTSSGVAVVAVMTSPASCPHGKCIYCPGGIEFDTPQSYTGREPAAMRAIQNDYDPYYQTKARIEQLKLIGHKTDKIDLIIMGGTFTSRKEGYREWFVKGCFDAMNGKMAQSLEEAHKLNEKATSRCIGLTVETRPDCFLGHQITHSLYLGATRVELGVQTTHDEILKRVNRGHTTKETKISTRESKEAGLKVCYHMMPGLPGSDFYKDLASFKEIFTEEGYMPDMLKIYPTLVIKGTKLYEMWKAGEYEPYRTEEAAELIAKIKRIVPRWVRIQRIQRDIPAGLIEGGVKKSHLRQLAKEILLNAGEKCQCIRCREVGQRPLEGNGKSIKLVRQEYEASLGKEVFLSFVETEEDALIGYARLRKCREAARLRELKVFGQLVPLNEDPGKRWQHRGYGSALLKECEWIAKEEWGFDELFVTSGVGVRNYYRKFGYRKSGPYMAKSL